MKAIKFLTHPVLLIISFLLILISGEHLGGFYALYLLLALPHGWLHSLLGLSGIIILLLSYNVYKNKALGNLLNIAGAILLVLSIVSFFYVDKEGYNYGTFYQTIPLISLTIFGFLSMFFISRNLILSFSRKRIGTKVSY